jgi:hypothetical protein
VRLFSSKWFQKSAASKRLDDGALLAAVEEMEGGLIDARLGGHVVKKRVALPGRGKRGGSRTLVVTGKPIRRSSSTALQRMKGQLSVTRN